MSDTILDRLRILRQTVPAGTPTDRICRDAAVALEAERALADELAAVLTRLQNDHESYPGQMVNTYGWEADYESTVRVLLARHAEARGR